jgi:hypothetical protein
MWTNGHGGKLRRGKIGGLSKIRQSSIIREDSASLEIKPARRSSNKILADRSARIGDLFGQRADTVFIRHTKPLIEDRETMLHPLMSRQRVARQGLSSSAAVPRHPARDSP